MDRFEERLRDLPLRPPSPDLDARILAGKPAARGPAPLPWLSRRIPLWLAAAASIALGLAGFLAGAAGGSGPPAPPRAPAVSVQVLDTSSRSGNPFDFTGGPDLFAPGKMDVRVETKG